MVQIDQVEHVDEELVEAFTRLVPQLSTTSAVPTDDDLRRLVESDSTVLLIARDDSGAIVGSLSLAVVRIPTGIRVRNEDVVVDEDARGRGVGSRLGEAAITWATEAGAKTVDLSSRPDRAAANRLYERLGFERRDTFVYRHEVKPPT